MKDEKTNPFVPAYIPQMTYAPKFFGKTDFGYPSNFSVGMEILKACAKFITIYGPSAPKCAFILAELPPWCFVYDEFGTQEVTVNLSYANKCYADVSLLGEAVHDGGVHPSDLKAFIEDVLHHGTQSQISELLCGGGMDKKSKNEPVFFVKSQAGNGMSGFTYSTAIKEDKLEPQLKGQIFKKAPYKVGVFSIPFSPGARWMPVVKDGKLQSDGSVVDFIESKPSELYNKLSPAAADGTFNLTQIDEMVGKLAVMSDAVNKGTMSMVGKLAVMSDAVNKGTMSMGEFNELLAKTTISKPLFKKYQPQNKPSEVPEEASHEEADANEAKPLLQGMPGTEYLWQWPMMKVCIFYHKDADGVGLDRGNGNVIYFPYVGYKKAVAITAAIKNLATYSKVTSVALLEKMETEFSIMCKAAQVTYAKAMKPTLKGLTS